MKFLIMLLASVLFLGAIIFPISAFASSNSGPAASGEGVATISGWVVSNMQYQFSQDPSLVSGVSFDLNGPADTVAVKLRADDTSFTSCTSVYGYHWQCSVSNLRLADLDEFRVIAVGN